MSDARGERALLQRLADGPVSGDVLAGEAGLTRAAVWKRIEALREAGIAIEAAPGRGYRLAQPLDLLDIDTVRGAVPASAGGLVLPSYVPTYINSLPSYFAAFARNVATLGAS